ncbi:MAG: tetratricopeptide repeat protein [Phycisphaeraceae bacterium]|nr:tetratricopeptide repeat protein [Phycisphaeraceae bacterium]
MDDCSNLSPVTSSLEARVRSDWARGVSPDLAELLAGVPPSASRVWLAVLRADAECRVEHGLPPTLGHYLRLFPRLAPGSQVVQELLAIEMTASPEPPAEATLLQRYGEPFRHDIRFVLDLVGDLTPPPERPQPVIGQRIGKYTLRGTLGRGSFGAVWLAWDTELECFIALKLISPTGDLRHKAASLMIEARAASGLHHPNVVGVRAAGQFPPPDDWLYIDMQVCGDPAPTPEEPKAIAPGSSLPERFKQRHPGSKEIARVMADVCRGVVAAHAQGVVHCDLKPANVLITPSGRVMVADFGLSASSFLPVQDAAQCHAEPSATLSLQTQTGRTIRGTPSYMSPEQARGENAKPISDVYALGAILYWLLTQRHPYERAPGETLEDLLARIADPALPGPALPRQTHPTLARICLKAMRKHPEERYASASALQADLEALLDRRVPPTAGPDAPLQPLTLWTRRNALPVSIAATAMVGLATLSAVALHQARRADERAAAAKLAETNAEQAAAAERERADQLKAVSEFQAEMLGGIDAYVAGVELINDFAERFLAASERLGLPQAERSSQADTLRSLLSRVNATDVAAAMINRTLVSPAVRSINERFRDQPLVASQLLQALANCSRDLGEYNQAMILSELALSTRRQVLGAEHPATLASISSSGSLLLDIGQLDASEPRLREALETSRRILGEEHRDTITYLNNFGQLLFARGLHAEAELLFREALEKGRRVLSEGDSLLLTCLNNVGVSLHAQSRPAEAEPYYREALQSLRRQLGDDHPHTLTSINNLGALLADQGKLNEAEHLYRESLERRRRVLGEDHPYTLTSINNLGRLLQAQERFAEAEACFRDLLERGRRVLGSDHPDTLVYLNNFGSFLQSTQQYAEAEHFYREAMNRSRRVLGEDHPDTIIAINNVGTLLRVLRRPSEAEAFHREGLAKSRRVLGEEHPDTLVSISNLGSLLLDLDRLDEAEVFYRDVLEKRHRLLGSEHADTLGSIVNLGRLLVAQGRPGAAVGALLPAEPSARKILTGRDDVGLAAFLSCLGRALAAHEYDVTRFTLAESILVEAYSTLSRARGSRHRDTLACATGLVDLYTKWHLMNPDAQRDAQASQWRARLASPSEPSSSDGTAADHVK